MCKKLDMQETRSKIIEQAAAFHTRIAAREMTPEHWEELESWINEDPEHRRVLEAMGDMAQVLPPLGRSVDAEAVPAQLAELLPMLQDARDVANSSTDRHRSWQPWHVALAAGVVVAVALSMFFLVPDGQPTTPQFQAFESAIAERRIVGLNDGSTVVLSADTELLVPLGNVERRLRLSHGEIFVEVASDQSRPFEIEVGQHVIRVTGTAFNVRYRTGPASATVQEGHVIVSGPAADAKPVALERGQRLVFESGATPTTLTDGELRNDLAWRDGWLHFDNDSLEDVVKELNLHLDTRIFIGSRRAAELQVAGAFNVDNLDALLEALEAVLPVTVTRKKDRLVIDYDAA